VAQRTDKKKSAPSDSVNSLAAPGALETGEKPENFAADENADIYKSALKLYDAIQSAFEGKQEQCDRIEEYWAIYQCKPDTNAQYAGNSQCYIPATRDAINARTKRTLKQLFPTRHKHIEAVGSDAETPFTQLALLEHDVRSLRLKETVRSDLVAGDVTGQWNLYIDWTRSYRRITELVKRNPSLVEVGENAKETEVDLVDPGEEEEATEETDVLEEGPEVVDFATEDLAVVPPTCNDIEKAASVTIRLRLSKSKVESLVDEGIFHLKEGETTDTLWDSLESEANNSAKNRNVPPKARASAAGVKTSGAYKYLLVYETTAKLEYDEGKSKVKRLSYVYYASQQRILGIVKAPQWGGKRPVISAPVERVSGSFFGQSKIEPVKFLQWNLNDFWNMGQDSAMYSLLPIWAADPEKNPNWASMVMGLAAVWPIAPDGIKPLTQPQLYKESYQICDGIKRQIWESMDVNEMMMGRMPAGRKNNQMMGQFQQDQMTSIMDHAERYEEAILNPLAERLFEYERQFRTTKVLVEQRGEIGVKAKMTEIDPKSFDQRYQFRWAGTSIVQSQQLQQLRIAGMNVLRGIPPQQMNGRKLDVTPILESFVEGLFGPELAPKILIDERNLYTVDAATENIILHNNMPAPIHEADDDQRHIVEHTQGAQLTGDPFGRYRAHIAAHQMAMQTKLMRQQGAPGAPGVPGPQGTAPGVPGQPRPGAAPGGPRGPQNPPGLPGPDQGMGPGRG
jgi:hypothetical protein